MSIADDPKSWTSKVRDNTPTGKKLAEDLSNRGWGQIDADYDDAVLAEHRLMRTALQDVKAAAGNSVSTVARQLYDVARQALIATNNR